METLGDILDYFDLFLNFETLKQTDLPTSPI